MSEKSSDEMLAAARSWWSTAIIDIEPGEIRIRGHEIQDLIGRIGFPEMIWLMLRGTLPSPGEARLLEAALVASVDHGPQAPSIAIARMAVTCGAEINNAMASAINVLGGVHGGAGQQCMELFAAVRAAMEAGAALEAAVDTALAAQRAQHGRIVAGYGHRWHPVDPRTAPLLGLVEEAREAGIVRGGYVGIARAVEAQLSREKGKLIPINIDGSTAVIFSELGFAPELGRGLFILSRSVGILAHAWEQQQAGERIKGPMPKGMNYTYSGPKKAAGDEPGA
jgi:citrate synthase